MPELRTLADAGPQVLITADVNSFDTGDDWVVVFNNSSGLSKKITGLTCNEQTEGKTRWLVNRGVSPIELPYEDTGSLAINRFAYAGQIPALGKVLVIYNSVSRWEIF